MRIIFFNISDGEFLDDGFVFFRDQIKKTDIFCFMEVDPDLHIKLSKVFEEYKSFYKTSGPSDFWGGKMDGQSIFIKGDWKVLSHERIEIFKISRQNVGMLQYLSIRKGKDIINIGNVHGIAHPGAKNDTPVRIKQSEKIIEYFQNKDGLKIIGGDFNLNPDTKSVAMFEQTGYKNLIKDFGIKLTRNEISWRQFASHPGFVKQYFADYVFTSPEVKVKNFEVPYMEISDHLPQILDFEI